MLLLAPPPPQVLAERLKAVRAAQKLADAGRPWLARLNIVLGLVAAAEGREFVKKSAAEKAAARPGTANTQSSSRPTSPGKQPGSPTKPTSSQGKRPPSQEKPSSPKGRDKSPPKAGPAKSIAASMLGPEEDEDFVIPPLQALLHLTRCAHLAARGAAWHELLNSCR